MRPGWVRFPHVPAIALRIPVSVWIALAALVVPSPVVSQEPAAEDPESVDSVVVVDQTPQANVDSIPPISPVVALLRSLILPGWGQASVGRPGRGAIYFGAGSAALLMVFRSQARLSAAKRAEPVDEDLVDSLGRTKETWIVIYGFVAFFSALDAWVSTHFWHFEPEVVMPEDGGVSVQLSYRLPLGFP